MEKRLYRNTQDKALAGVASGLAEYFEVDTTWIRLAFVLAFVFGFSGLLIYIILWIAIPEKPFNPAGYSADYRVYEDQPRTAGFGSASTFKQPVASKPVSTTTRIVAGVVLIFLGGYFMLDQFDIIPEWFDLDKLWPLVLIIPGVLMILGGGKRKAKEESWNNSDNSTISEDQPVNL